MHEERVAFDSPQQRDEALAALNQYITERDGSDTDIDSGLSMLGQHIAFAARQETESPRLKIDVVFETKPQYEQCVLALKSAESQDLNWLGRLLELPSADTQYQSRTTVVRGF